jgi:hypothetical protein
VPVPSVRTASRKRGNRLKSILFFCLFLSVGLAQSTDAVLSGTVSDPTGAVISDATVTVTNTRTGVERSTKSNSSGIYLFPALQPGVYRIAAQHPGFRKYALNDVTMNIGDKLSINLPMEVGPVADSVEVKAENETLAVSSASIGGVLNAQMVQQLPLTSRDALGLVSTMPGVQGTNFNGAQRVALNITLDGINVQDNRINSGVFSTLFLRRRTPSSGAAPDRLCSARAPAQTSITDRPSSTCETPPSMPTVSSTTFRTSSGAC